MHSNANAEQVAYWNGVVAERWTRDQEALDRAFAPFTERLFEVAGLRSGERVLDIGCGCGTTTLVASRAVGPGGAVLGVDVSVPMLAKAASRSSASPNASFVHADASTFAFGETFDAGISRFGVMFFERPTAAFAHLRSALIRGGRIAFACWRPVEDNPWVTVPLSAALRHVPPQPASGPEDPGPFSFGDPSRVRRILERAGFSEVQATPFDGEMVLSEDGVSGAAHFTMNTGPTGRLMREASDDEKARVRAEIEEALAPFTRGGATTLRGGIWLVSARGDPSP